MLFSKILRKRPLLLVYDKNKILEKDNRYLELLPNVTFNDQDKKLIDWFFSKRNDSDITTDGILSILSKGVDDYANY